MKTAVLFAQCGVQNLNNMTNQTHKQSASELAENCAIKIVEHYRVGIAYEIGSSNKDSAIFIIRHVILQQLNLTDLIRKAQEVDYYKAHPGIERNDEKGYLTDWKSVAQSAQQERDQLKQQNIKLLANSDRLDNLKPYIATWTLLTQKHRGASPEQLDAMFQQMYKWYIELDVEGRQAITTAMSRQEVIK